MSFMKCYALMNHGRVYTLQPNKYGSHTKLFKWVGFCDGDRCGFFKTKADFEAFVQKEPPEAPLGPHAQATFQAEAWSTMEGRQFLNKLAEDAWNREYGPLCLQCGGIRGQHFRFCKEYHSETPIRENPSQTPSVQ